MSLISFQLHSIERQKVTVQPRLHPKRKEINWVKGNNQSIFLLSLTIQDTSHTTTKHSTYNKAYTINSQARLQTSLCMNRIYNKTPITVSMFQPGCTVNDPNVKHPYLLSEWSLQRNALFLQKQLRKFSSIQNITGKEGNYDHACKEILLIFIDKMNQSC